MLHYVNSMPTKSATELAMFYEYSSPCGGMTESEMKRFLQPLATRGLITYSQHGPIWLTQLGKAWLLENPTPVTQEDVYPQMKLAREARQAEMLASYREEPENWLNADDDIALPEPTYISAVVAKDPEKKRVEIHLMPEVKEALVKLAKADNRSLLNYIETLLKKHVEEKPAQE